MGAFCVKSAFSAKQKRKPLICVVNENLPRNHLIKSLFKGLFHFYRIWINRIIILLHKEESIAGGTVTKVVTEQFFLTLTALSGNGASGDQNRLHVVDVVFLDYFSSYAGIKIRTITMSQ